MDLPTYIQNLNQENYNEEMNQTLRDGLSDNGWTVPAITTTDILDVVDMMPVGTIWFDTIIKKLYVKTADQIFHPSPTPPTPAVIEQIQSI